MTAALFVAAAVILVGVVVVALGYGGELARDRADLPASDDLRTAADVANYVPPAALLGYHAAATERALALSARAIAERDAEIARLRSRLAVPPGFAPEPGSEPPPPGGGPGADALARDPSRPTPGAVE